MSETVLCEISIVTIHVWRAYSRH